MQKTPLISVIIPFHNEEKFLPEAIESVLNQTYTNWEILLVDDGSTNNSTGIAKNYAANHPDKIFYLEHEGHQNKFLCASRNLGLKNAKGELISLLDADDVWLPEKLANQVKIFQQYPDLGLVAEGSIHWYSWQDQLARDFEIPVGSLFKNKRAVRQEKHQDKVFSPMELLYSLYPFSKGAAAGPCSWMFSKKAVLKAGGFEETFTKEYQLYEDQAFLCKIYLREKVYLSSACNNLYRQREGSLVQSVKEKGHYHKVRHYFLTWFGNYLEYHNITNPRLDRLLNRAMLPYRFPTWYYLTRTLPENIMHLLWKPFRKLSKYLQKHGFASKNTSYATYNSFDAGL